MDEEVDILMPPLFTVSGKVKTRYQAYRDGDWIGTFNLWVVTNDPEPAIIYQQRSPQSSWEPDKLDVTGGGHLQAGERLTDGLREIEEELGKQYDPQRIIPIGRKVYVGFNADGTSHNNVIDLYLFEDNSPLTSYKLEENEVYAICKCPLRELLKTHQDTSYNFEVPLLTSRGKTVTTNVSHNSFPKNWDNYHHKIALLADRYFKGEKDLIY